MPEMVGLIALLVHIIILGNDINRYNYNFCNNNFVFVFKKEKLTGLKVSHRGINTVGFSRQDFLSKATFHVKQCEC